MKLFVSAMKWIMLVSGLLTCTMVYAVIAPAQALQSTFGATLEGPLAEIIVRNWGALVTLMGIMIVYGAFKQEARTLVLTIAGLSKIVFIALVLGFGTAYLDNSAGIFIAIDGVFVLVYIAYLIVTGRQKQVG